MPGNTLDALLDSAVAKSGMSRVAYDLDEIRDRLTVAAAMDAIGIAIDADAQRVQCPFCGGGCDGERSLSIFADGRRYRCHRGSCAASGDALAILRAVYDREPWRAIIARAAALVQLDGNSSDSSARANAKRAKEARAQARAAARALKATTASRIATERYISLVAAPYSLVQLRLAKLREWLEHRGLGALIAARTIANAPDLQWVDRRLAWSASVDERGQLVLPILADDDNAPPSDSMQCALGSTVIGMATRCYERTLEYEHDFAVKGPIVEWSDAPRGIKTLTLPGSSTAGVFGSPKWIGCETSRAVVAVGMTDHLAAHIAYPDGRDGGCGIVSANGDGRIDVAMRMACRRLVAAHEQGKFAGASPEVVLITDADASGRAARERALAVAGEFPLVRVGDHDLDGHHDLCEQVAACAARKST